MEYTHFFVIYDPTQEEQPALDRAALIAAEAEVSLHVFACIYADVPKSSEKLAAQRALITRQQDTVRAAVAPLRSAGINVTTEIEWDRDWCKAAVRASIKNGADVVLKSSFPHTAGQRLLNKTSDWSLIRECSCPVMLVKATTDHSSRKVLAAIDVRNGDESYAQLNQNILDFSRRLADSVTAEVHFINAHRDLSSTPDRNALIRNLGIESDRMRIRLGEPGDVIVENARELNASLVVIGNAARSGISALLNGNTVEKIVDKVECDVLSMP